MSNKLMVFGNRVKPNRHYQIVTMIFGGFPGRKEELISNVMTGRELFDHYGSIEGQKKYEVHRRKRILEKEK